MVRLVVAVVGLLLLLWLGQRRLIYLPSHALPDPATVLPHAEEVLLETDDGLELGAWFVPATGDPVGATVVVFNGNAGNRADRAQLAAKLGAHGLNTLLVDYRGYGGNPGRPSERGLMADGRAAVTHVAGRPDVDPDRLVYFGESLGAGVAIGLALERPPAILILRSPFSSLPEVASVHYPLLPTSWLLRDRYPNEEQIAEVRVPVLVVAGSRDAVVPEEQSRRVFEAAPDPKRYLLIEAADHNDAALAWGDQMIEEVAAFIQEFAGFPEP
ncbi:MAG: alpha/beta hydrolase [Acidimicrobiia bacterium]